MAQNDIYIVRQKSDGTFEEIANSPFSYDATNATDLPDKTQNTFHIGTKLRVEELEVNGQTTIIDQDTTTSEQLLVTNDGTGPAAVINQLGTEGIIDIQDDGTSALYIRGDAPFGGFVGLGTKTPEKQLELTGDILLQNNKSIFTKDTSNQLVESIKQNDQNVLSIQNVGAGGIEFNSDNNLAVKIDQSGKVAIGSGESTPEALLELKRVDDANIRFSHKTSSIIAEANVDSANNFFNLSTITDTDLTLGTNSLPFFTLTKEGNVTLEKKTSGSTLTGGDLTIDGTFTSKGDMFSVGDEEILYSKTAQVSGSNVAKSFKFLEFAYNTHDWDSGTAFIIEIFSDYYNAGEYHKYILGHGYVDFTSDGQSGPGGSEDGNVDVPGSRDYFLKLTQSYQGHNQSSFRARLSAPESTGLQAGVPPKDIGYVKVYLDLKHYAGARVKVTSLSSENSNRISVDAPWSGDDEYKFWNDPQANQEDLVWDDHDPSVEPGDALFASTFYGYSPVNWLGEEKPGAEFEYFLKPADTGTSMVVAGNVGIGTTSPDSKLHLEGATTAGARVTLEQTTADLKAEIQQGSAGFALSAMGNQSLLLQTNGSERLRIDQSGNVGIGTNSPSSILEMAGDPSPEITFNDTTAGDRGSIEFQDGDFNFWSNYISAGQVSGNATKNLTIKKDGKVGIGTSSPDDLLEVGDGTASANVTINHLGGTGANFKIKNSGDLMWQMGVNTSGNINNDFVIDTSINPDNPKFIIKRSGNIGIGTATIDTDLHVKASSNSWTGGLKLEDYNAQNGWLLHPDSASGLMIGEVYSDDPDTAIPRFIINKGGNVGIGTTADDLTGLQLGTALVVSSATGGDIVAHRSGSSVNVGDICGSLLISNSDTDGNEDHFVGMWGKVSSTNGSQDLHLAAGRSGYEVDAPHMTINSDGNVGIGTAGPGALLHLNGGAANNQAIFESTDGTSSILFKDPSGTAEFGNKGDNAVIMPAGVEKMRITSAGNVGIGTSSPEYKLEVQGGEASINGWRSRVSSHHANPNYETEKSYILLAAYDSNATISGEMWTGRNGDGRANRSYRMPIFVCSTAYPEIPTDTEGEMNVVMGSATGNGASLVTVPALRRVTVPASKTGSVDIDYVAIELRSGTAIHDSHINFTGHVEGDDHLFWDIIGESDLTVGDIVKDFQVIGANMFQKGSNVGIGTRDPSSILELAGDPSPEITFNDTSAGDRGSIEFQDGTFNFWSNYTAAGRVSGSATNNLTILKGGNVGIGTTSPSSKLEISNTDGVGDADLAFSDEAGIKYTIGIKDGSQAFQISESGPLGATSSATQGTRFLIDTNGNVGIGTTSPSTKLEVNGSTKIKGGLYLDSADGFISLTQKHAGAELFDYLHAEIGAIEISGINPGPSGTTLTSRTKAESYTETFTIPAWPSSTDNEPTQKGVRYYIKLRNQDAESTSNGGIRFAINDSPDFPLHYNAVQGNMNDNSYVWSTFDITDHMQASNTLYFWSSNTDGGVIYDRYVFASSGIALPNEPVEQNQVFAKGLTSFGNVGIGTTSPSHPLTVQASGNMGGVRLVGKPNNDNHIRYDYPSMTRAGASGAYTPADDVDHWVAGVDMNGVQANDFIVWNSNRNDIDLLIEHDTGKVGIGQPSPGAKLEVKLGKNGFPNSDVSEDDVTAFRVKGNDNAVIDMGINGGLGGWIQSRNWQADSLPYSLFLNPLGGNVGIGTTDAKAKLHIPQPLLSNGQQDTIGGGDITKGAILVGSETLGIGIDNNEIMHTGNMLNIGTYLSPGNSGAPAGTIRFNPNQTEAVRIEPGGNVGIGPGPNNGGTSPTTKLHVDGDLTVEGDITVAGASVGTGGGGDFSIEQMGRLVGSLSVSGSSVSLPPIGWKSSFGNITINEGDTVLWSDLRTYLTHDGYRSFTVSAPNNVDIVQTSDGRYETRLNSVTYPNGADREFDISSTITFTVTDLLGNTASKPVTYTVANNPIDDAPSWNTSTTLSVAESGRHIDTGAHTVANLNATRATRYEITGGTNQSVFVIDHVNTLYFKAGNSPDYEAGERNFAVEVTAYNDNTIGGADPLSASRTFNITVTDNTDDNAPAWQTSSTINLTEHTKLDTLLHASTTGTIDDGAQFTIVGGADSSFFVIDSQGAAGGSGRNKARLLFKNREYSQASVAANVNHAFPDFENPQDSGGNNSFAVTIRATNPNGGRYSQRTFTVNIVNAEIDDAPTWHNAYTNTAALASTQNVTENSDEQIINISRGTDVDGYHLSWSSTDDRPNTHGHVTASGGTGHGAPRWTTLAPNSNIFATSTANATLGLSGSIYVRYDSSDNAHELRTSGIDLVTSSGESDKGPYTLYVRPYHQTGSNFVYGEAKTIQFNVINSRDDDYNTTSTFTYTVKP